MAWSKEVTLWCDEGGCNRWTRPGPSTVGATEDRASEKGWEVTTSGEHYCPVHAD